MNSNKVLNPVLLTVLVAVIIAMSVLIMYNWPEECDVLQTIKASITVKDIGSRSLIGFNTDKDALKSGSVSPYTQAMRKINLQHHQKASVTVVMVGDLASWTTIAPANFTIPKDEIKEIAFMVDVPPDAPDGNYTGVAVFCIKEI